MSGLAGRSWQLAGVSFVPASNFSKGVVDRKGSATQRVFYRSITMKSSVLPEEEVARSLKGKGTAVLWFRNDLRVRDNSTLARANTGKNLFPVFVFDPRLFGGDSSQDWGFSKTGALRTAFLIESVATLRRNLKKHNSELIVRVGHPEEIIPEICSVIHSEENPVTVIATKETTFEEKIMERRIRRRLESIQNDGCASPEMKMVWEGTLHHLDDLPFDPAIDTPPVFTQYRKLVEAKSQLREEIKTPATLKPLPSGDWNTEELPKLSDLTDEELPPADDRAVLPFRGGEDAALERIDHWMWRQDLLREYKKIRNGSGTAEFSSKLSPWLALGCVSPRTIYSNIQKYENERVADENTYWLVFELITRDFFHWTAVKEDTKLFAWNGYAKNTKRQSNHKRGGDVGAPTHYEDPKPEFWKRSSTPEEDLRLQKWINGETGVPFVDAGMRELKATGFMSNRLRQNVASFLIWDLRFPDWRAGAEYFESVLLDHDVAANYGNWAYIAGVGSDPMGGRQFNVIKQAMSYDADATFTKLWCPELKKVPAKSCHEVFKLPPSEQEKFGVRLGETYPAPIVKVRPPPPPGSGGNRRGNGDRKGGKGGKGGNNRQNNREKWR